MSRSLLDRAFGGTVVFVFVFEELSLVFGVCLFVCFVSNCNTIILMVVRWLLYLHLSCSQKDEGNIKGNSYMQLRKLE